MALHDLADSNELKAIIRDAVREVLIDGVATNNGEAKLREIVRSEIENVILDTAKKQRDGLLKLLNVAA